MITKVVVIGRKPIPNSAGGPYLFRLSEVKELLRFNYDDVRVVAKRQRFRRQRQLIPQIEDRHPWPRHGDKAEWVRGRPQDPGFATDALVYDITGERWVLEPRGHEAGPPAAPVAVMLERIKRFARKPEDLFGSQEKEIESLRRRIEHMGVDPDYEWAEQWCVVHDKPADGYGFCYKVSEDKPKRGCRAIGGIPV